MSLFDVEPCFAVRWVEAAKGPVYCKSNLFPYWTLKSSQNRQETAIIAQQTRTVHMRHRVEVVADFFLSHGSGGGAVTHTTLHALAFGDTLTRQDAKRYPILLSIHHQTQQTSPSSSGRH